jgi:low affinity Fe/Cu permease
MAISAARAAAPSNARYIPRTDMSANTTRASHHPHKESFFARVARLATEWSGTTTAFIAAATLIVLWLFSRPLFESFDTWQLVINTATTIITFLMVFLIQRAQNKDSKAIHLKLNELVAAVQGASNRLINVEGMTEEELAALHQHYCKLVDLARSEFKLTESHSVEEAVVRHRHKKRPPAEIRPAGPAGGPPN